MKKTFFIILMCLLLVGVVSAYKPGVDYTITTLPACYDSYTVYIQTQNSNVTGDYILPECAQTNPKGTLSVWNCNCEVNATSILFRTFGVTKNTYSVTVEYYVGSQYKNQTYYNNTLNESITTLIPNDDNKRSLFWTLSPDNAQPSSLPQVPLPTWEETKTALIIVGILFLIISLMVLLPLRHFLNKPENVIQDTKEANPKKKWGFGFNKKSNIPKQEITVNYMTPPPLPLEENLPPPPKPKSKKVLNEEDAQRIINEMLNE